MIEFATKQTEPTDSFKTAATVMSSHVQDLGKLEADQVAEMISLCKVKGRNDRPGRNKEVRILFNVNLTSTGKSSVAEMDVLKAVKVILSTAGGSRSNGPVPPSLLERSVSTWIGDRNGKGKGKAKGKDK